MRGTSGRVSDVACTLATAIESFGKGRIGHLTAVVALAVRILSRHLALSGPQRIERLCWSIIKVFVQKVHKCDKLVKHVIRRGVVYIKVVRSEKRTSCGTAQCIDNTERLLAR